MFIISWQVHRGLKIIDKYNGKINSFHREYIHSHFLQKMKQQIWLIINLFYLIYQIINKIGQMNVLIIEK